MKARTITHFRDPNVEAQMQEVVKAANSLFGALDTHAGRTDNPHNTTAAQIGAETPAGAQAKADVVQGNLEVVQTVLTGHIGEMGSFSLVANGTVLEIFYGTTKIGELDSAGNLKVAGTVLGGQTF